MVLLCMAQPFALPPLLAVTADVPLAAASFAHAAFIAGVHWAAISALQPAALFPALEATVAVVALVAWAQHPPSADAFPFTEATTAFVVVVDPALAVLALFWASHACAAVAVQANANRARASSRSDFMDPTSRKV
jgi:hypothetical protein